MEHDNADDRTRSPGDTGNRWYTRVPELVNGPRRAFGTFEYSRDARISITVIMELCMVLKNCTIRE